MAKVTIGDAVGLEQRNKLSKLALSRPRNFSNFITSYLEFTKNQESTKKIHRWVAVSIIAAALERKVFLDAGHFTVYPNFYIFIIGESGIVRKSTSTGIGVSLLRELPNIKLMSERVTDASLIQQLQRSFGEFSIHDQTYKQSPVFCYASELVVFMREVSGSISELLTTFWDCPKDWIYETKGDGQIKISGPCLNLLGASTPNWLTRAIPADEMEGGLASRVIFVVEKENPDKLVPWPMLDPKMSEMKPKLVEDLKQINSLSGQFRYTQKAYDFYAEWYKFHRSRQPRFNDPRFRGYHGRKPVTVWKLAMILAIAESNELEFNEKHLQAGIEMLEDLELSMLDAFEGVGQNHLAEGYQKIRKLLQERRKISHRELIQAFFRDYNGSEIRQIMSDMVAAEGIQLLNVNSDLVYRL